MEIRAPRQFNHVGDLAGYMVPNNDPRSDTFNWDAVTIDLRRCGFVRPAAMLWCTVYPLLVVERGVPCELTTPVEHSVQTYLNDTGLFDILKEAGVRINYDDQRNLDRWQLVLPLTRLRSVSQVESLEDSIIDNLESRNLTSANLYTDVSVAFAELGNNAIEHANSEIDAYGLIQFYDWGNRPRFVCAVADGGIGIRASLQKNPAYAERILTDWNAIEYATRENTSGTGNSTRGMGLHHIAHDILPPDRELNINSGNGFLHMVGSDSSSSLPANLFPGTSAFLNVPA